MANANEYDAFGVHYDEAIAALEAKKPVSSKRFKELTGSQKHTAYAIAGATKLDLVTDVHKLLLDILKTGGTLADFRRDFYPLIKQHGWSIDGSKSWRTQLIFNQTMRSSRMAGAWHKIQANKKERPFLVYFVIDDSRLRKDHKAWKAIVLPVDHSFWLTHYPPNGWGCRCYVVAMSQRDLDRLGLKVTEAPEIEMTERINTRTGEVLGTAPKGIDLGWDYNVGMGNVGAEQAFSKKLKAAPDSISNQIMQDNKPFAKSLMPAWTDFVKSQKTSSKKLVQTVGMLTSSQIKALNKSSKTKFTQLVVLKNNNASSILDNKKLAKSLPELFAEAKAIVKNKSTGEQLLIIGSGNHLHALTIKASKNAPLTNLKKATPIKKSTLKSADFILLWGSI